MRSALAAKILMLLAPAVLLAQYNKLPQKAGANPDKKGVHSVDQLLLQMERDWARAIVRGDVARIREILAPEVVLTTPEGTVLTREDDLAELEKGEFKADIFDSFDMNVKVYGQCAVVTGQTKVKGKYRGKEVEDHFRWTDTFVRRNAKWQIVASQATPIPKPQ